jgi:large subunit ribosomal protein L29
MKVVEIRKLSTEDLAKQTTAIREEIASLKRRVSLGEVQNVRLIRTKRKDLARMLTILGEQLAKENMYWSQKHLANPLPES